jgi:hypothetical protein
MFDSIEELTPGNADMPLLWRPRKKNFCAMDLIITVGKQVYFIQCTASSSHDVVIQGGGKSGTEGLFPQAAALKRRGFDTGGSLTYVHVTEEHTEPDYKLGTLKYGDKRGGAAAISDEERARVKQYVVGVSPSGRRDSAKRRLMDSVEPPANKRAKR